MSNPTVPDAIAVASSAPRLAGRFQWTAILLCAATMFIEGYDAQFMGSVVPGVSKDWGIAPGTLWPALSSGLVGLMLGAFLIGPLADSFGRRRLVIYSVAAFGILTVASAMAESLPAMVVYRFLIGLGLGGAMPNTVALTAEFSPTAKRASAVAIMFCSFSLGASFGGFIAAWLMPEHGWQSVVLFCGGMAVALLPFLIVGMPESLPPKEGARASIPAGKLFSDGRARITILFWIIFFANLMELYFLTSWLPTTISAQGVPLHWAQIATALVQIGGIAGALALAPLLDRYGPQWLLPACFAVAALSIAALGLSGASVAITLVAALGCGIGTVGAQNLNNGVAAKFYPMPIRATGVGWALAVGRIGSIFGPAIGGVLLSTAVDIRNIFFVAVIPPLVGAVAYIVMGRLPEPERGEA